MRKRSTFNLKLIRGKTKGSGFVGDFLRKALLQGISPRKLALTCTLGIVIGILPLVWGTTLLCAALACLLRLNQAAIQAVNYLTYPLQIALFVPFYTLGARIFPWGPAISSEMLARGWKHGFAGNIPLVLIATLKALGAWLLVAPPLATLLYFLLLPVARGMLPFKSEA